MEIQVSDIPIGQMNLCLINAVKLCIQEHRNKNRKTDDLAGRIPRNQNTFSLEIQSAPRFLLPSSFEPVIRAQQALEQLQGPVSTRFLIT